MSFFQIYIQAFLVIMILMTILWVASIIAKNASIVDLSWGLGFSFEAGGDFQLAHFKADAANKGKVMDKGFWRYTRHPNYFGDSSIWCGYGFICLAAGGYLPALGSLLMTALITKVSGVILLEKTLKEQKPQYKEYIEKTSSFIPWLPKK